MNGNIRTRFAPSPTGYMHLGNLRTALYAFLYAKSQKGKFILRIEDTDRERYVEDATQKIYNTLADAGISYDEGPDQGGEYGPYIQSERREIYKKYALDLVEKGGAYFCFCSKDDSRTEEGYDRHCRDLSREIIHENLDLGKPYVIRQKINLEGSTSFNDAVFGEIKVENNKLDDQVLLKRDGLPTYNFAHVIDDHLMKITHVIRGSEYLSSTPKYIQLYDAFNWDKPEYIHLPLILGRNEDGSVTKLSKRHGAVSFQELIQEGYLPAAIINYIALLGWSPKGDKELFSVAELIDAFSIRDINKNSPVFDYKKLDWINSEHIKLLSPDDFSVIAYPFSKVSGTVLEHKWKEIATLLHSRVHKFTQIPEMIGFMFELCPYSTDLFINKKNQSTIESSIKILRASLEIIKSIPQWNQDAIFSAFENFSLSKNTKLGYIMWPLRIALSGLTVTPGGAMDIMYVIGREEAMVRLSYAIELIEAAQNPAGTGSKENHPAL